MSNNFSTKLFLEELDFQGEKFIFNFNKTCCFYNFFNEDLNDVIFSLPFLIENVDQNKNVAHRVSGIINFSFSKLTGENDFLINYSFVPYTFKGKDFMGFFNETFERLSNFFIFCFNEIHSSYVDFFKKSSLPALSKFGIDKIKELSKVTIENIEIFMKLTYSREDEKIINVFSKHNNFFYGNENVQFNISCYTNEFEIKGSDFKRNVFMPRDYSLVDFPPSLRLKLLLA